MALILAPLFAHQTISRQLLFQRPRGLKHLPAWETSSRTVISAGKNRRKENAQFCDAIPDMLIEALALFRSEHLAMRAVFMAGNAVCRSTISNVPVRLRCLDPTQGDEDAG